MRTFQAINLLHAVCVLSGVMWGVLIWEESSNTHTHTQRCVCQVYTRHLKQPILWKKWMFNWAIIMLRIISCKRWNWNSDIQCDSEVVWSGECDLLWQTQSTWASRAEMARRRKKHLLVVKASDHNKETTKKKKKMTMNYMTFILLFQVSWMEGTL